MGEKAVVLDWLTSYVEDAAPRRRPFNRPAWGYSSTGCCWKRPLTRI